MALGSKARLIPALGAAQGSKRAEIRGLEARSIVRGSDESGFQPLDWGTLSPGPLPQAGIERTVGPQKPGQTIAEASPIIIYGESGLAWMTAVSCLDANSPTAALHGRLPASRRFPVPNAAAVQAAPAPG